MDWRSTSAAGSSIGTNTNGDCDDRSSSSSACSIGNMDGNITKNIVGKSNIPSTIASPPPTAINSTNLTSSGANSIGGLIKENLTSSQYQFQHKTESISDGEMSDFSLNDSEEDEEEFRNCILSNSSHGEGM